MALPPEIDNPPSEVAFPWSNTLSEPPGPPRTVPAIVASWPEPVADEARVPVKEAVNRPGLAEWDPVPDAITAVGVPAFLAHPA